LFTDTVIRICHFLARAIAWKTKLKSNSHNHSHLKALTMTAPTDHGGRQDLTAQTWWTVDRSLEPPLEVGATALVEKCVSQLGWSFDFCLQVLDGYRKFLNFRHMFQDFDGNRFHPPIPIDQMWKKHMEDSNYEQDCKLLFGRILCRQDEIDQETKNRLIERTLYVLRLQCKQDYNKTVWDFGRGEVDTAPSTSSTSKRGGLRKTKRVDWHQKLAVQETLPRPITISTSRKRKQSDIEQDRKDRLTEDGCMLPARPAKKNANGTFNKPVGRKPAGMEWDYNRGVFAPVIQIGTVERPVVPRKWAELADRKTRDGFVLPSRPAKKNADGTFVKPVGRTPSGMKWDENRGLFVPIEGSPSEPVEPTKNAGGTPRPLPFKKENRPVKATPDTRKGTRTEDGYYIPRSAPRQRADGTFIRPAGRGPVGMVWDTIRGAYAPFGVSSSSSPPNSTAPWVTPTASSTETGSNFTTANSTRMVRRVSQDIEEEEQALA
jgi:hypothetical protein